MKALVRTSRKQGELSLKEIPVPRPLPHQVVAKVAYAGICASDLDIIQNRTSLYQPPVVLGHEFSAIITEVGTEVKGFGADDLIVSETTFDVPGEIEHVLNTDYHLRDDKAIVGWTENGGFAEYVLLNSHFIHQFPSSASPVTAALAEPTAIAAESVYVKGGLKPVETVVVVGPGPIGVLCCLLALEGGAAEVFLAGLPSDKPLRFKVAQSLGVRHCIDVSETDALAYIHDVNRGRLPDLVIDATGSIKGFNLALDLVKRNGRLVEVGSITQDTMFSWEKAAYKALNLLFVFSSSHRAWEIAVQTLSTPQRNVELLVTDIFPLAENSLALQKAGKPTESLKVLLKP